MHPQSIVHGMARFRDGALIAHVGLPDMRVPISYALTYPGPRRHQRAAARPGGAVLARLRAARPAAFRCLGLARQAGQAGGTAPCVLNAANEVAVALVPGRPAAASCRSPTPSSAVLAESDRRAAAVGRRRCWRPTARARELARDGWGRPA